MNKKSLQTRKTLSDHPKQGGRFDAKLAVLRNQAKFGMEKNKLKNELWKAVLFGQDDKKDNDDINKHNNHRSVFSPNYPTMSFQIFVYKFLTYGSYFLLAILIIIIIEILHLSICQFYEHIIK